MTDEDSAQRREVLLMAATAAQKVVVRCDEAKESGHLDLADCELMHVPDALYLLLKSTPPATCDFSQNDLKKIPVKLCRRFPAITGLKIRNNKLTVVPDEIMELSQLKCLDLSNNQITHLPETLYHLASLEELTLDGNNLEDLDLERLSQMTALQRLSIRNNPITESIRSQLQQWSRFTVHI